VGRAPLSDRGRVMAATLACVPRPAQAQCASQRLPATVVASHRSAGFLLGLVDPLPRTIEVICTCQQGRKHDGIKPRFVAFPEPEERGSVEGMPCTGTSRTLVDLAGVLGERSLREAFERAAIRRTLDLAAIEAVLTRGRRRGATLLRAIVEEWRPVADLADESKLRSTFEARLLPLLAAEKVQPPEVNARVPVAGRILEVDLLWRQARLVVEADSRRHHGTDLAFERDRKRDRDLLDAGYTVIRVTYRQAEPEAAQIAASIHAHLRR
jgi:very-short-patch-repair endonuclease